MNIEHFFQLQNALFDMRMERPRTRMMAIYMATFSKPINENDPWLISRYFSLNAASDWLGWHMQDVVDAIIDLAEQEVIHIRPLKTDRVEFFYLADERQLSELDDDAKPVQQGRLIGGWKAKRSIYVITANEQTSKIGIAFEPEKRLSNLQIGSPLQKLTLAYVVEVPASAAHRVERLAHKLLAEHAMGQEWFRVPVQEAIDTVIAAIAADEEIAANAAS